MSLIVFVYLPSSKKDTSSNDKSTPSSEFRDVGGQFVYLALATRVNFVHVRVE